MLAAAATASTYLANKPSGTVLAMLIVALLGAAGSGVVAFMYKTFWAIGLSVFATFLVLAFLVHS